MESRRGKVGLTVVTLLLLFYLLMLFDQQLVTFSTRSHRKVLLISLDGFRHDYIELTKARNISLPNFDRLQRSGVRAMQVQNVFPSITLPNHHSLVTGLHPESHGIVLNTFIDPFYPDHWFDMDTQSTLNEAYWFDHQPEPIWVTLQRQPHRYAGSMLWPITDAHFAGDLPFQQVSEFTLLDSDSARYPWDKRVTDVIWWLNNPRYSLDLVLMYFDEPDETGHAYGPNSLEVAKKVAELDVYMGQLLDQLQQHGLQHSVDVIVTADHGMAQLSPERVIEMDRYVDPNLYYYTLLTPVAAIYPKKDSDLMLLYNSLRNAHPNMKVFLKGDVPNDLHYNANRRIAPLVAIADNGWSIVHKNSSGAGSGGNHGYNSSAPDVHPFFIAAGDSFRVNATVPLVHMLDIYPLMCHLLGIEPRPHNGSLERIQPILNSNALFSDLGGNNFVLQSGFYISFFLKIMFIVLCCLSVVSRQKDAASSAMFSKC